MGHKSHSVSPCFSYQLSSRNSMKKDNYLKSKIWCNQILDVFYCVYTCRRVLSILPFLCTCFMLHSPVILLKERKKLHNREEKKRERKTERNQWTGFLVHCQWIVSVWIGPHQMCMGELEISTDLYDKYLRIKHAEAQNGQTSDDRRRIYYIAWMDNIKWKATASI